MAESFWATLEREVLSRRRFKTQAEAKMAIFAWIEGWYNPHRRHSSLGYRSPINYERRALEHRVTASDDKITARSWEIGGYKPQGSMEIVAPGALHSAAAERRKRKSSTTELLPPTAADRAVVYVE